jgi:two-component system response regulator
VKSSDTSIDILFVENNPDEANLTMHALARLQRPPALLHLEDGARALEYLFATGAYAGRDPAVLPRLVLTDLKMPRLDGLELLKRIRADARTRDVPVVILSSSAEEAGVVDCMRHGANSYVLKPVDFDAFQQTIASLGHYWLDVNVSPVPGSSRPAARLRY